MQTELTATTIAAVSGRRKSAIVAMRGPDEEALPTALPCDMAGSRWPELG